ncbi:MAG TPA: tRNA pseudouridine(55) synthase TruB [Kofleriaceae bacterium]|nr:tRNA pseudouridine(55) synthase TruB [Kofleriaceae bacterium]
MSARPPAVASGVLVVDKPAGITSRGAVAEVGRRLDTRRAGHAGTLDPMATGVLVVCLGEATKIAGLLVADDKSYDGELELGRETDTLDADGQVVRERIAEAAAVDRAALAAAMAALVGDIEQVPPMYSAVRQAGRRLHELARAGQEVERAARAVTVRRFDLLALDLLSFGAPRASFAVDCSKGTYVRSLVADVGEALGCGAHLTALRRTRSGGFGLDRALALADVSRDTVALPGRLVDPADALVHLPRIGLTPDQAAAVAHGKPLSWQDLSPAEAPAGPVCMLAPGGKLLALVEVEGLRIRYRRVFPLTREGAGS